MPRTLEHDPGEPSDPKDVEPALNPWEDLEPPPPDEDDGEAARVTSWRTRDREEDELAEADVLDLDDLLDNDDDVEPDA